MKAQMGTEEVAKGEKTVVELRSEIPIFLGEIHK